MALYTVNINLEGERCLVIGGGTVAERKALKLMESGSAITIIAPILTSGLQQLAHEGKAEWLPRSYRPGDVKGYLLVIASTDDADVNTAVYEEARREHVLVNCVDKPAYCNFFVPSVIQRGDLQIAISTSGSAPFLSKKIRQMLEPKLYAGLESDLRELKALREAYKLQLSSDAEDREQMLRKHLEPFIDRIIEKLQAI